MLKKHLATLVLATAGFWVTGSAQGAFQLLQFQPIPVSPPIPEFSWTGPGGNFIDAAGAHGNGDGTLPVANQTAPGLEIDTPLTINAAASTGIQHNADGSTTFYDASMTLSDSPTLATPNNATFLDTGAVVAGGNAYQTMSDGTFTITATDGTTILLQGTISQNTLTVPLGGSSSGFEGGVVTYTGGLLFNALTNGGFGLTGDTSISMTTVTGQPIGVTYDPNVLASAGIAPATISAFDANATGVFDVVPEPASLGLVALVAVIGGRRRRV